MIILQRFTSGKNVWLSSEVVDQEVNNIPDLDRKYKINGFLTKVSQNLSLDVKSKKYAIELLKYGFSPMDALHLSLAELNGCEAFFSTDDFILRKCRTINPPLRMRVLNPAIWIMELNDNE